MTFQQKEQHSSSEGPTLTKAGVFGSNDKGEKKLSTGGVRAVVSGAGGNDTATLGIVADRTPSDIASVEKKEWVRTREKGASTITTKNKELDDKKEKTKRKLWKTNHFPSSSTGKEKCPRLCKPRCEEKKLGKQYLKENRNVLKETKRPFTIFEALVHVSIDRIQCRAYSFRWVISHQTPQ